MNLKKIYNFSLILTACIKPIRIPYLKRKAPKKRLEDYKSAFLMWCENQDIKKIIFIENSGFDLEEFKKIAKKFPQKKIEIISSNLNNSYPKKLGKGFGEYLCMKEVFKKSKIINRTDFFVKVSGRYYIKNFKEIIKCCKNFKDINLYLKDNLRYADSHLMIGSKSFFLNYVLKETIKTNDSKGVFFEHCVARATLKAVSDGLSFNHLSVYPKIHGIIGTNNKRIESNFFKDTKLFFFGKLKSYFFSSKKY